MTECDFRGIGPSIERLTSERGEGLAGAFALLKCACKKGVLTAIRRVLVGIFFEVTSLRSNRPTSKQSEAACSGSAMPVEAIACC